MWIEFDHKCCRLSEGVFWVEWWWWWWLRCSSIRLLGFEWWPGPGSGRILVIMLYVIIYSSVHEYNVNNLTKWSNIWSGSTNIRWSLHRAFFFFCFCLFHQELLRALMFLFFLHSRPICAEKQERVNPRFSGNLNIMDVCLVELVN